MQSDINVNTEDRIVWMGKEVKRGEIYGYLHGDPMVIDYEQPGIMHVEVKINDTWRYFYVEKYYDLNKEDVDGRYIKMFEGLRQEIMRCLINDTYLNIPRKDLLDSLNNGNTNTEDYLQLLENNLYGLSSDMPVSDEYIYVFRKVCTESIVNEFGDNDFQINTEDYLRLVLEVVYC